MMIGSWKTTSAPSSAADAVERFAQWHNDSARALSEVATDRIQLRNADLSSGGPSSWLCWAWPASVLLREAGEGGEGSESVEALPALLLLADFTLSATMAFCM